MQLSELVRSRDRRAPAGADAERRRARPAVERLEEREVPAVAANQEYVSVLFQGLVGHAPDANTLTAYSRALDAGTPRIQVTSSILASPEYRGNAVEKLYENILGRPADLGSLNAFTAAMPRGMSLDDIRAELFGSDEFFLRSGANPASFLFTVYNDILGRPPDPGALGYLGEAQDAPGRTQIARDLLHSPEAYLRKTVNDFQVVLGSPPPDIPTALFFYNAYQQGNRDEGVLAFLLMSGQFYDPIAADAAATNQTDPNAAAAQYLNNTHLLQVGEPGSPGATTTATLVESPAVGVVTLPSGYNALGNVGLGTFGTGGFIPVNGNGTGTNGTGATGTGTTGTTGTGTVNNPGQTGFGTTGTGTTVGSGTGGGTTGATGGTGGTTGTTGGTTGTTGTGGTTGSTGLGSGSGGTGLTGPGTPTG